MIRIRQVKVLVNRNSEEELKKKTASKLKIRPGRIEKISINKRSIDARDKNNVLYVYEVDISIKNENQVLKKRFSKDIFKSPREAYQLPKCGTEKLKTRPIIVGSGPAGLFCTYLLAEEGYFPLLIERGEKIEDRVKTVNTFFEQGILNQESNVQFGEGGAGTFSDGKLNTLVKDSFFRKKKVLEIFVEHGAPKEILYDNHPHIGTDILRKVIVNIRNKIIKMGGEIRYQNCLTNLVIENNRIKEIEINHKYKLPCEILVLAIGHSARDTFQMLHQKGLNMTSKPFAVGIRIQHPQKMIDTVQYGSSSCLEKASYKLVCQSSHNRGVYTFCMCPGGYVVNASSEENRLVVNGMSNYKRDSINANSAIVVTVSERDFGPHPLDGISYQQKLEEKAYKLGNGMIPIQLYQDYKKNQITRGLGSIKPVFKGRYSYANLNELFPKEISDSIKEAIESFACKIDNFNRGDAILAAVESRTSSPIRIVRDKNLNTNVKGIYPCGEGSGYAGGITTSAMDGIKVVEQIVKIYTN
ncbi:MAG: NAD(P)-binding protein [Bacilli bacterium]|nr:NAD(P)-binding protein [Bacilli bacterium]